MDRLRRYEDDQVLIEIKGDVVYSTFKDGCVVNKDVSACIIKERIRLSEGKSYINILDGRGVKYWTMSSRNNYMKDKDYYLLKYAAVIISSAVMKTIWNYTVKFFPPPIPIKVFTNMKAAEEWVAKMRDNH